MQDAWHIIKWIWVVVFGAYLIVQVVAAWRLKGIRKKRSTTIALMMVIVMGVSDAIRSIFFFENRVADQIGMLVIGMAAIVATTVLVVMFCGGLVRATDGQDDAEHGMQRLKLS